MNREPLSKSIQVELLIPLNINDSKKISQLLGSNTISQRDNPNWRLLESSDLKEGNYLLSSLSPSFYELWLGDYENKYQIWEFTPSKSLYMGIYNERYLDNRNRRKYKDCQLPIVEFVQAKLISLPFNIGFLCLTFKSSKEIAPSIFIDFITHSKIKFLKLKEQEFFVEQEILKDFFYKCSEEEFENNKDKLKEMSEEQNTFFEFLLSKKCTDSENHQKINFQRISESYFFFHASIILDNSSDIKNNENVMSQIMNYWAQTKKISNSNFDLFHETYNYQEHFPKINRVEKGRTYIISREGALYVGIGNMNQKQSLNDGQKQFHGKYLILHIQILAEYYISQKQDNQMIRVFDSLMSNQEKKELCSELLEKSYRFHTIRTEDCGGSTVSSLFYLTLRKTHNLNKQFEITKENLENLLNKYNIIIQQEKDKKDAILKKQIELIGIPFAILSVLTGLFGINAFPIPIPNVDPNLVSIVLIFISTFVLSCLTWVGLEALDLLATLRLGNTESQDTLDE